MKIALGKQSSYFPFAVNSAGENKLTFRKGKTMNKSTKRESLSAFSVCLFWTQGRYPTQAWRWLHSGSESLLCVKLNYLWGSVLQTIFEHLLCARHWRVQWLRWERTCVLDLNLRDSKIKHFQPSLWNSRFKMAHGQEAPPHTKTLWAGTFWTISYLFFHLSLFY